MALKCPNPKCGAIDHTGQKPQPLKGRYKGREHWQCKVCKCHWDRPIGSNGKWE